MAFYNAKGAVMKRVINTLIILTTLLPTITMADGFVLNDLNHNHGYVYRLLQLLFGSFVTTMQSSHNTQSTTVIYTTIAHLGYWSCIVAGCIATAFLFVELINAWLATQTHTVRFMGSVGRYALVLALVTPMVGGGVSIAQRVGVLKLALLGDAIANIVYSKTVTKMLTDPPKLDTSQVDASKLAANVFKAEVCAYGVLNHSKVRNSDLAIDYQNDHKVTPTRSSDIMSVSKDSAGFVHESTNDLKLNWTGDAVNDLHEIMFAPDTTLLNRYVNSYCGTMTFPTSNFGATVFDKVIKRQQVSLKKATVRLINNLRPVAYAVANVSSDGTKLAVNADDATKEIIKGVQTDYQNAVKQYEDDVEAIPQDIDTNVLSNDALAHFINQAGWGLGVIWWKRLADVQTSFVRNIANFSNVMDNKVMPVCLSSGIFGYFFGSKYCINKEVYPIYQGNIDYMIKTNNALIVTDKNAPQGSNATAKFSQICNSSGCSFTTVDTWMGSLIKEAIAYKTGSSNFENPMGKYSLDSVTNITNQRSIFDAASSVGSTFVGLSTFFFGLSFAAHAIAGSLAGIGKSALGFLGAGVITGALQSAANWVGNFMYAGAWLMIVPAEVLLVIVPFIPLFIWGVLLISYLLMLVEAFIAVNFGVALWVISDEMLVSQRIVRTIMMISALMLRPLLFVIGLATSYAIAPLALTIWNTMFFWGSSYLTDAGFITELFYFAVYAGGIVKFTFMCYNISFILPDKVLEWLGSGFGDMAAFGSPADFGDHVRSTGGTMPSGGGSLGFGLLTNNQ